MTSETHTPEQKTVIMSLPIVRGKRNGLFWAHNDANLLADLSHMGLCKMPILDRCGVCDWQFVSRIKPAGFTARAAIAKAEGRS